MPAPVDVCNLALSQLGKAEITSMDETSAAAGWCRRVYDLARRDVLSRSDWVFARRAVRLIGTADFGHPQFPYQYARPADFVKVRAIGDGQTPYQRGVPWQGIPYELNGTVINGTSPLAALYYIGDIIDPNEWPPAIVEAVALKMASMMAMQATGRSDAAVNIKRLFELQLLTAIEQDASQERTVWTDAPGDGTIGPNPVPHGDLPDYPYDETMLWGPGPGPVGTPVSAGGGAPPSEIVTIYEEGAGVDTDYVAIYRDPN